MKRSQLILRGGNLLVAMMMVLGGIAHAATTSLDTTKISLNFKNMDVREILNLVSEKGALNLVIHSDVNGTLTLFLSDVTVMEVLDAVCDSSNLAYINKSGIYYVMSARQYEETYGRPYRTIDKTRIFQLEHANPDMVQPIILQLRSKDGRIFADRASNAIVVIDKPDVLRQVGDIIAVIDQPLEMKTIELQNVDVSELQTKIQPFLSPGSRLQVDIASNRIILQDSPREIMRFEQLVAEFDRPGLTETQVFLLAHADPAVIVAALTPELTPDIGRIHQDVATNMIIVTDFPATLDAVARIVEYLDIMTPEVMIEAKIIQISLSDRFQLGVNWEFVSEEINGLTGTSNFNLLNPGDQGLQVAAGDLETDNYTVLVEALQTIGNTNLLASPRIMALNNEEASILVGSTVPYKTTDTREEGSSIRTFERVIYVDVGVKLRVTPRIHQDGLISMTVHPEVSSVTSFVDNIPVVKTTQTTSTVTVRNGATAIIAGLMEDEVVETTKMVPLLGKIPLLGALFRSTDRKIDKRELIILLTPRIVDVDEDMELPDLDGQFE